MNAMLLAQLDGFRDLGLLFQAGSSRGLLLAASAAAIVLMAFWLVTRWLGHREKRAANSPARLLAELVAAHRLRYPQRRLLLRLARHHELKQPALLFVEPALWSPEKLGPAWDRARGEVELLRQQLFAAV